MSINFCKDYSWAAERRPPTVAGTKCRHRSEETRPPNHPDDDTQFNLGVACDVVKQPRVHRMPRWFMEVPRQTSGATREVIHTACCLHQPTATTAVGDEVGEV